METIKEQLKIAIEKQLQLLRPTNTGEMKIVDTPSGVIQGWFNALRWMDKLLDSQPEEEVGEDLEQAFCYYTETIDNYPFNQDDEKYMYDAFQAGAQWQREQMLKGAIPGYLHDLYKTIDGEMLATVTSKNAFPYKKHGLTFEDKDKIKLIILKEE